MKQPINLHLSKLTLVELLTMIHTSKSSLACPSFLSAFAFLGICVVSVTVVSEQHRKISNVNSCFIKIFHVVNIIYVPFKGVSHCCNKDKEATVQDQIKMQLISLCSSLCNWGMKIKK